MVARHRTNIGCKQRRLCARFKWHTEADPGFEKGGGARGREPAPKIFLANLGDFLKNFAQKGMGVRPLRPFWIVIVDLMPAQHLR